jgi:hypothetical protein
MAIAIALRSDATGTQRRSLIRHSTNATQATRLLALAVSVDGGAQSKVAQLGHLGAVVTLRGAGSSMRSAARLRTGLVVVDDEGFIFTPIARYLEADRRGTCTEGRRRSQALLLAA